MLSFFNRIEVTEPARNLRQIGPTTAIDLNTIKAVYKKDHSTLVIRFGSIGYIELKPNDMFWPIDQTAAKLLNGLGVDKL